MRSVDPNTGAPIHDYPDHDDAAVGRALDAAGAAHRDWRDATFADRAAVLRAAAGALRDQRERLAALMTAEMGKPIVQSDSEVEKCAGACEYFAEHAERYLAIEFIPTDASRSYVRHDPLGVLLAIMPWNFPFWQVFRAAAPALMAGNGMVLKHASNVPGCALAIEDVFRRAGAPAGLFTTLLIDAERAEALIDDPRIAAVTLTGSEGAGRAIARRAGAALKPCVLELGGSDAFLVLEGADVDAVAQHAVQARLINNGQSCIAAKRFIVVAGAAEAFEHMFAARMAAANVGNPADRTVELGPLARADLRDQLHDIVTRSVAAGARLVTGGQPLARPGYFYAPTVLAGVEPGMAAFDEETFGPVAAVTRARDAGHAVELANHSRYGLGASIWTNDAPRAEALAAHIEAGSVFVNGIVKSDPRLPFGGVKASGYGRELSAAGIREFVNLKTVWVRETPAPGAHRGAE